MQPLGRRDLNRDRPSIRRRRSQRHARLIPCRLKACRRDQRKLRGWSWTFYCAVQHCPRTITISCTLANAPASCSSAASPPLRSSVFSKEGNNETTSSSLYKRLRVQRADGMPLLEKKAARSARMLFL